MCEPEDLNQIHLNQKQLHFFTVLSHISALHSFLIPAGFSLKELYVIAFFYLESTGERLYPALLVNGLELMDSINSALHSSC